MNLSVSISQNMNKTSHLNLFDPDKGQETL